MERMEVDQCAGAAAGGLRRSISAPMITSVSERMAASSPVFSLRQRRVSVNCSCPSQEDNMEALLQGTPPHRLRVPRQFPAPSDSHWQQQPPAEWFGCQESGVTPNSSPSPTRRAGGGASIRWPALTPLKRKVRLSSACKFLKPKTLEPKASRSPPPPRISVGSRPDSKQRLAFAREGCRTQDKFVQIKTDLMKATHKEKKIVCEE
ncbi:uncharacterized protein LOC133167826 isoform X2 [Syngnathus typhle]|uniref:uncharacterized protein LOC133167826 isoform X2 n=1 Tax=Syngnathus typhle TaxID=161592 RepID=UPI002A6AF345|nr:uncharacterized protein LOC133167826 isoform X2 [Syngnathus typhle]